MTPLLPTFTQRIATRQLANLRRRGHYELAVRAAQVAAIPLSYLLAVWSRETNVQNILGDKGHGHGYGQIDIRSHAAVIAANPEWRTKPYGLMEYSAKLLAAEKARAARAFPLYNAWKIGAAAYNCGWKQTELSVREGDCDRRTTGKNYGGDVTRRQSYFALLLGEKPLSDKT